MGVSNLQILLSKKAGTDLEQCSSRENNILHVAFLSFACNSLPQMLVDHCRCGVTGGRDTPRHKNQSSLEKHSDQLMSSSIVRAACIPSLSEVAFLCTG